MTLTTCWSCSRPHTGSVWCPHCSAPVDPYSPEACRSPYWRDDPRNIWTRGDCIDAMAPWEDHRESKRATPPRDPGVPEKGAGLHDDAWFVFFYVICVCGGGVALGYGELQIAATLFVGMLVCLARK